MVEKINEIDFLKEHPSLEGKIFKPTGIVYNRKEPIVTIDKVHETQLDKAKVKRILEDIRKDRCDCENISKSFTKCHICELIDKKEKELGL